MVVGGVYVGLGVFASVIGGMARPPVGGAGPDAAAQARRRQAASVARRVLAAARG
jgi:hypothetical protein